MKKHLLFFIALITLNLAAHKAEAGIYTYTSKLQGPTGSGALASSSVLYTFDDQYYDMTGTGATAWHAANINRSVTDYIRLKYTGGAAKYYSAPWSVQVVLQVDTWDENGSSLTSQTCTLKIDYDNAAASVYKDIDTYVTSGGHRTKVTVSSISYTGSVSSMPADVMLESVIEVDRLHAMDYNTVMYIGHSVGGTSPCTTGGPDAINFYWDFVQGAEEYDFEWLFKSEYDSDPLDFTMATRITTTNQYYSLNTAFDNGKIYYRIRPVGIDLASGTKRLEGEWTTEGTTGVVVCNIEKRNWTYNASYAEEGKRKEVMSYFDGSSRTRQAVTLSNTENIGLVAESMYDYEGRPAIQTLPAPAKYFQNDLKFYQYFNLNISGSVPFSKKDFDTDLTSLCGPGSPAGMNSSFNGASLYYSEYNSKAIAGDGFNKAIPDADEYPFTQIVYSNDGTVKMETGVGTAHKLGSTHETEYYTATPLQEKLDRLFGNEVGYAEHYKEKVVVDPNGQISVSYENLSGKVIATCMRGGSPANLRELGVDAGDQEPYMAGAAIHGNFESHYNDASEAYVTEQNFMVSDATVPYDFTYELTPQDFEALCSQNFHCQYLLTITVKDDCGNTISETAGASISAPNTTPVLDHVHSIDAQYYTSTPFTASFSIIFPHLGVYRIGKKLSLDPVALAAAKETFETYIRNPEHDCIPSLEELQDQYALGVDWTECGTCKEALASMVTTGAITFPLTIGEQTFANADEYEPYFCQQTIPDRDCNGLLAALKADMSPGGQYYSQTYPVVVDAVTSYIPLVVQLAAVNSTFYEDFESYVSTNHCATLPAWSGSFSADLAANWDPCWAGYLVQFHPEYCRWQSCVALSASYDFDADLLNTTYAEVTTTGAPAYFDITTPEIGSSLMTSDPFFMAGGVGAADAADFIAYRLGGCTTCNDLFYYSTDNHPTPLYDATTSMWEWTKIAPAVAITNEERWSNFVKLYINAKAGYIKTHRCAAIPDNTNPPDMISDISSPVIQPYDDGNGHHSYWFDNMAINDPDLPYGGLMTTGTGWMTTPPDPDDLPGEPEFCYYTNSVNTVAIGPNPSNPTADYSPVISSLAMGSSTPVFCSAYTMPATPPASYATYVFYVKIEKVPFNYPVDATTGVFWSNSNCYIKISDPVTLPQLGMSSSLSDITAYLSAISNAINGYAYPTGSLYQFTCNVTPPAGGSAPYSYSYQIVAPSSLGAWGKNSNLKLLVERLTSTDEESTFHTGSGNEGLGSWSTAERICNPVLNKQNCVCVQLSQMHEYYEYIKDGSGAITINDENGSPVSYPGFGTYAAAQMANVYSTSVTAAAAEFWWNNCSTSNETTGQHAMVSPWELDNTGAVAASSGNTSYPVPVEMDCDTEEDCQQQGVDEANFYAEEAYETQIAEALNDFVAQYKAACMNKDALNEKFKVDYEEKEYHYTLYYYDQAGNLVRTVPPNGVDRLGGGMYTVGGVNMVHYARVHANDAVPPTPVYPHHTRALLNGLVTNYQYNTLNQLVEQETPDAGVSNFWYNNIGQLRFSQNAKQVAVTGVSPDGRYSYTMYDGQGRITEVGENDQRAIATIGGITVPLAFYMAVNNSSFPSANGEQVTKTYYDAPVSGTSLTQNFLRKRVVASTIEAVEDNSDLTYDNASYYDYDVHGNVSRLYLDNPHLQWNNNRYKTLSYTYDLISGNVNTVSYQAGQYDQFYHRYEYDANNRITHAYTSEDNIHWQQDARYFYYLHGPLARTEMGEDKVQGLDYAYTLHGWIKTVNSNVLDPFNELGLDGNQYGVYSASAIKVHQQVARDVFGYSLEYYAGDYKSTYAGLDAYANGNIAASAAYANAATPDLFNGNIKAMATGMYQPVVSSNPVEMEGMARFFKYDQLNRIKEAQSHTVSAASTFSTIATYGAPLSSDYYESFKYDANGNIKKAYRNGYAASPGGVYMDDMTYNYDDLTKNNKLVSVDDDPGASLNYTTDIDDQTSGSNYEYDPIGNLTSDEAEGITGISWSVYGKILKITKATQEIEFKYDPAGNRIIKIVKPLEESAPGPEDTWDYTYYMRDAQGNVMAVYSRDMSVNTGTSVVADKLLLKETHIYGSARLGLEEQGDRAGITSGTTYTFGGYETDGHIIPSGIIHTSISLPSNQFYHKMGYKRYELSNHLGNVNVVISDRKISVPSSGVHSYYLADVYSAQDYYSFGAVMPGRCFSTANGYRYGFNGQEKDDEVSGDGNSNTAEFWQYDTRLGRRWNLDPKPVTSISSYSAFQNNPILLCDPLGDTAKYGSGVDKLIVNIAKIFSKKVRDDFKVRDGSSDIYTYRFSGGQRLKDINLGAELPLEADMNSSHYNDVRYGFGNSDESVGRPVFGRGSIDIDLRGKKEVQEDFKILQHLDATGTPRPTPANPVTQTFNLTNLYPGERVRFFSDTYPDNFQTFDASGTSVDNQNIGPGSYNTPNTTGSVYGSYTYPAGTTQLQVTVSSRYNWPGGRNGTPSVGNVKYTRYRFPDLKFSINFTTIHFK